MQAEKTITKVEAINDVTVRVHFSDGSTLRMSRASLESGSWKRGTDAGLVRAVQGAR